MGQAQINVRTRACSRTSIARTKQAALTHNVRGKELIPRAPWNLREFQRFSCQLQVSSARASHFFDAETCEFPSLSMVPVGH